jgi:hypothetical protein
MLLLNIKENTFYYIPNSQFEVPDEINPLNENNPLSDGKFQETPAKWTGMVLGWQNQIKKQYENVNYGISS